MATQCTDYDFTQIEAYWQKIWAESATFDAKTGSDKPKYYILDMFPYPSGAGLHAGHAENFTGSDILGRFHLARGYNVLHPMGWDAFGLPAEQYAVKTGTHPAITTATNIDNFRQQLKRLGFALDWSREVNTTDPAYYRWTQWIFLQLFKHGLAYVDERAVNWCPELGTVLANEEVIDGKSEVGGFPVERRNLRQWVLRITRYADRLLEGLNEVDWPTSTKTMQENWIGKSTGAEVDFALPGHEDKLTVYTTRPDTLFGCTYMVLSPEHPLVEALTQPEQKDAVARYREAAARKSDLDRTDLAKEKTGVFTGSYALNPVNGKEVPVWVADYVLMGYGTGAIMAVPAQDERDWEFAQTFDLPIVRTVQPPADWDENKAYTGDGVAMNSDFLDGLGVAEAKAKMIAWLEAKGGGRAQENFKLRDWLFARQRYWGEPFPLVWVTEEDYQRARVGETAVGAFLPEEPVKVEQEGVMYCAVPLPEAQLPVTLPETDDYKPEGNPEGPLAKITDWVNVWVNLATGETVSKTEAKPAGDDWVAARRETNTMPQWAGSCWYYLRYCDPHNDRELIDEDAHAYWGSPDMYVGGAEHAVLHLLYARFWHMFLVDIGVLTEPEPFRRLFHQGTILGEPEYTLYRSKDGEPVCAKSVGPDFDGTREKVLESEVEKKGDGFVWKGDPLISCEVQTFKMSKSRGNVVNPDDYIASHGADSLRTYLMFMGPFEDKKPWNSKGIEGVHRFLKRLWREVIGQDGALSAKIHDGDESAATLKLLHQTIQKVTEDVTALKFNTAISSMMILLNHLSKESRVSKDTAKVFVQLVAPFAPHMAEELWARLGGGGSVTFATWPEFDPSLLVEDTVTIPIMVSGKRRGEIQIAPDADEATALELAKAEASVARHLEGKTLRKVIYKAGKVLNVVAG